MENTKIKKIMVELENGAVLEFDKQAVLFVEDEMTATEKKIHSEETKMCCIAGCSPALLATATGAALGTLAEQAPGMDAVVMMKHMDSKHSIVEMLEELLG